MPTNYIITIAIAVLIIAVMFGMQTIKQVPQGYHWTLERFGRFVCTLKPGLHFLIPFVDNIGYRVNMKEQVLDIASQEVISADNAMVTVNGVVFFVVLDAAKSAYEVNQLDFAITNLVITNLRTVLGSMELDEMLAQRARINTEMLKTLGASVQPWGIKITRIEIKDISPPADLIEAMAKQMKAEREKRAAILEAEGQKQSKILKAEGEKQSAILQSEGVRQATILQAEAKREAAFREAEGRERQAKAEAVATEMMSLVLEEGGNLHALNYFIAQRYLEALGQLAQSDNQKVMMLPMESTQILGSLGGIRELLDAAAASSTHHKKG
jgi:regulator of protease activity HflC (stomatin/prohibitin superfamily)